MMHLGCKQVVWYNVSTLGWYRVLNLTVYRLLGAFPRMQKAPIVMCVRLSASVRFPLDRFPSNFIVGTFMKIC